MASESMRTEPIGKVLIAKMVASGLLKDKDKDRLEEEIKAKPKLPVSEIILKHKFLSDQELICFLSDEFSAPSGNPNNFIIDEKITKLIPADFAHKRWVMPISRREKTLTVALENPGDLQLVDDLKAITNLRIRTVVALAHEIGRAIDKHYPMAEFDSIDQKTETVDELIKIVQESKAQESLGGAVSLLKEAQETPIIKVANLLILDAIRRKASDLFIEPWEESMRIRCRVDGLLEEVPAPPKAMGAALVSRFKVMSNLDIAERRIPQDGRFKIKVQNREVDIRVSMMPTSFGEKVCLRILDKTAQGQGLEKLGFTPAELEVVKECALKPYGMILVTGPTGSGKTTTLYSILKFLDTIDKNITTVEDPVEYETDGINQVNVREAIGLTFPAALRSILRQDPDIILIGEIRDVTTMDIAIKSALTGHLVLSTLHTNDTAGAIVRMRNMGIEPFLITSSVHMVSAQRLLRRLCPTCKVNYRIDDAMVRRLRLKKDDSHVFYRPVGCVKCRSTGYHGRTIITEILPLTNEVKDLILKNASGEELKRLAKSQGTTTLRDCGIKKAMAGETSLDEVLRLTAEDLLREAA